MKEIRFEGFNSRELITIGELLSKIGNHSADISADDLKIIIDEKTGDVCIFTKNNERLVVNSQNELEKGYLLSGTGVSGSYDDLCTRFYKNELQNKEDLEELFAIAKKHNDERIYQSISVYLHYERLVRLLRQNDLSKKERNALYSVAVIRGDTEITSLIDKMDGASYEY